LVLVKLSKVQGWQVLALVLRGEGMLQGSREGQGWTWSNPKIQHGHKFRFCPEGVCIHGRMNFFVEIWKSLWWIAFIYIEE
jgi:hypothetical protein